MVRLHISESVIVPNFHCLSFNPNWVAAINHKPMLPNLNFTGHHLNEGNSNGRHDMFNSWKMNMTAAPIPYGSKNRHFQRYYQEYSLAL